MCGVNRSVDMQPVCVCVCVGGRLMEAEGAGWRKVQTRPQKAASVLTLTEFDSVFSEAQVPLEGVY